MRVAGTGAGAGVRDWIKEGMKLQKRNNLLSEIRARAGSVEDSVKAPQAREMRMKVALKIVW